MNHAFNAGDQVRKGRERQIQRMPMEARPVRRMSDRLLEASIYALGLIVCGTLAYVVLP